MMKGIAAIGIKPYEAGEIVVFGGDKKTMMEFEIFDDFDGGFAGRDSKLDIIQKKFGGSIIEGMN
jgi:hypothetical protein